MAISSATHALDISEGSSLLSCEWNIKNSIKSSECKEQLQKKLICPQYRWIRQLGLTVPGWVSFASPLTKALTLDVVFWGCLPSILVIPAWLSWEAVASWAVFGICHPNIIRMFFFNLLHVCVSKKSTKYKFWLKDHFLVFLLNTRTKQDLALSCNNQYWPCLCLYELLGFLQQWN